MYDDKGNIKGFTVVCVKENRKLQEQGSSRQDLLQEKKEEETRSTMYVFLNGLCQ